MVERGLPDAKTPFLCASIDTAADQWLALLESTTYIADADLAKAALRAVLEDLVGIAIAGMSPVTAKPVGARLAQAPFDQLRLVAQTVENLAAVAPEDRDAARRWAAVVGQAVDGYAEALRERSLHQQEQILAAAISVRTSEVVALQEQLRHQATHDSLTGLTNRAHLENNVDAMLAAPLPLGLLIIDLDGFKGINDRLGHAVGDEVLVVVGRRMRAFAASDDIVARYGGDEFIVASRASESDLHALADRVRSDLREPFLTSAGQLSVSASVGVAYHDGSQYNDFTSLLRTADNAMYASKASQKPRRSS